MATGAYASLPASPPVVATVSRSMSDAGRTPPPAAHPQAPVMHPAPITQPAPVPVQHYAPVQPAGIKRRVHRRPEFAGHENLQQPRPAEHADNHPFRRRHSRPAPAPSGGGGGGSQVRIPNKSIELSTMNFKQKLPLMKTNLSLCWRRRLWWCWRFVLTGIAGVRFGGG